MIFKANDLGPAAASELPVFLYYRLDEHPCFSLVLDTVDFLLGYFHFVGLFSLNL